MREDSGQSTGNRLEEALEESRRRQAEALALLEASRSLFEYRDFADSARIIFSSCKKLIGAAGGYIALLSEDGAENEVVYLDPGELTCNVDQDLPMPIRGLRGVAYRSGEAVIENDFPGSKYAKFMPEGHILLENAMFAPLIIEGKAVGLLGLANKPGGFTEKDAETARAFAGIASVALHNSWTFEQLEQSEGRFRSVAESAGDAVVIADGAGIILFWNRAAEAIFGHSAGEAVGNPVSIIVPERLRDAHVEGLRRVASTGRTRIIGTVVEVEGLRKDGTELPVELSLSTWKVGGEPFFAAVIRDVSERKRLEEALHQSEERYRTVADFAYDWEQWTLPDGSFRYVSPSCERITGYTSDEFISDPELIVRIVLPDDRQMMREHYDAIREQEDPVTLEFRIATKDGEERWIEHLCRQVFGETGEYLGRRAANRDVTERKRAEEALRESEEKFKSIFENSDDAFFILGAEGNIIEANRSACDRLGYSKQELLRLNVSDLDDERNTALIPERMERLIEDGHLAFETVERTKDGGSITVEVNATAVEINGRPAILSVMRDVTARKEAEALYKTVVLTSMDGFWTTDTAGDILEVNDAYCRMLGYGESELLKMNIKDIEASETPEDTGEHMRQVIRDGHDSFESRHRKKSGEIMDVEVSVNFLESKGGRFFVFTRDVTERKKAEAALREKTEELEAFSYSVSHDLRAPLRAIDGFSRMLFEKSSGKLDAEQERLLGVIQENTEYMGELIEDLLTLSRVGLQELRETRIDMSALARAAVDEAREGATATGHRFTVGKLPACVGDPILVRQVLVNLLSNATKFSGKEGEPTVEVGFLGREEEQNVYFVRDNGVGFDMRYYDKLFGVFQRLHSQEEYEGTGVGLALVQRIVRRHGGRVWAEGEVGKGATFFFTLPAAGDGHG